MREAIHVAGAEDKTSAELEGILAQFVLMMAGGARPFAGSGIVATQEMKQIGRLQLDGVIRLTRFVDQKGKQDARLLAKLVGIHFVPEADGGQSRASIAELLFIRAQLRDVFAAKDSTVVA